MPVIQSQSAMRGKAETFTYVDFDRSRYLLCLRRAAAIFAWI
jgi:hypothetical protein